MAKIDEDNQSRPLAYSIADAAEAIGVSKSALFQVMASGDLPVRKLGRRTLVLRDDLMAYLQRLPTRAV